MGTACKPVNLTVDRAFGQRMPEGFVDYVAKLQPLVADLAQEGYVYFIGSLAGANREQAALLCLALIYAGANDSEVKEAHHLLYGAL